MLKYQKVVLARPGQMRKKHLNDHSTEAANLIAWRVQWGVESNNLDQTSR